jgi:hypothetical protein
VLRPIVSVTMASFKSLLLRVASLVTPTVAASCWRNSTCSHPAEPSFPGPWEANIFAPTTRSPKPVSILSFPAAKHINTYPNDSALSGNGSALVFDFGVETGGVITVKYTLANGPATLGLAFTEARDYIGYVSDSSNGNYRGPGGTLISEDGALLVPLVAEGKGVYEMPVERLRGGFRYLTLYILANGTATILAIDDVSLEIVFQPTWSNLRAYLGYFHSSDDDLNKIWYSGAYTLQTNAAPPETGRVDTNVITKGGWLNNAYLGVGQSLILDGAKRDRWVWPGDMGTAVPSAFYSTGDMESIRNALQTIYDYQVGSHSTTLHNSCTQLVVLLTHPTLEL